jgi:hypothetical protein
MGDIHRLCSIDVRNSILSGKLIKRCLVGFKQPFIILTLAHHLTIFEISPGGISLIILGSRTPFWKESWLCHNHYEIFCLYIRGLTELPNGASEKALDL